MSAVHAVVRLLADPENRVPEGGGMLVSSRHVVTCAHVCSNVENEGVVHFDFPYRPDIQPFRARRMPLDSDLDMALLEILGNRGVPEAIAPVSFMAFSERCLRADVDAYGFPADFSGGDWAYGKLIGKTADGFFQIDQNSDGKFVQPGFSGTPGWMDRQRRGVGMVAQRFPKDGKCSVYLIPAAALAESCRAAGVELRFAEPEDGEEESFRSGDSRTHVGGGLRNSAVVHGVGNTIHLTVNEGFRRHDREHPPIDLSYYRIDRNDHIQWIGSGLKDRDGQAAIFAVHGHILECHDKFLECLCEFHWSAQVFPGGSKPKLFCLNWPATGDSERIFDEVGRELANQAGLPEDRADPDAFNERTASTPVVACAFLSSGSLRKPESQRRIFEGFREFWSNWPSRSRRRAPLLAILGIMYRSETQTGRNWWPFGKSSMSRINAGLRKRLPRFWGEALLPCLESVSLEDVLSWTGEPDIRERCNRSGRSVQAEIGEVFAASERMHMAELAKDLARRFPMGS